MRKAFIILASCVFLAGCSSIAPKSKPKPYEVHYTNVPIKVDGKLDEPAWKKAEPVNLNPIPRSLCTEKGTVKILWDDKYVYFGGVFCDSDIVQLSDKNWRHYYRTGDLMEIFLKPSGKHYYWELYGTPNNLKNSLFFWSGGRLGLYDRPQRRIKGILVKSTCEGTLNNKKDYDKQWTTEMAVPIKALEKDGGKVKPGKVWYFLIGRYNYSIHLDRKEITRSGTPRSNNFHDYKSWSRLEFMSPQSKNK